MTKETLLRAMCAIAVVATASAMGSTKNKTDHCSEPNRISIASNQVVSCDDDSTREVIITPPTQTALRLVEDLNARGDVIEAQVKNWPVRAMYWNSSKLSGGHWIEYDTSGAVIRSNFLKSGDILVEYLQQGLPIWLGGQHIYTPVDAVSRLDGQTLGLENFVLVDGRACPIRPENTAYEYYRQQDDRVVYLSGNCRDSVKEKIGKHEFWVYPEDRGAASRLNGYPLYWAVQYFDDPESPLLDAEGQCLIYCEGKNPDARTSSPRPTPASTGNQGSHEKLSVAPPPSNALMEVQTAKLQEHYGDPVEVIPPTWPVRAIFNSRSGIFEFDTKGNLVGSQEKYQVRAVEIKFEGNSGVPLWSSRDEKQKVYRLLAPNGLAADYPSRAVKSGLVLSGRQACPTQIVAEVYGMVHADGALYLNGSCENAIKRKIGDGNFMIYPEDATVENPQYWAVQYFDDPISPILDAEGQCWLYCKPKP